MDQILFEIEPIKKSQSFDEITYFRVNKYELEQKRLEKESMMKELVEGREHWVYNASKGRSIKRVVDIAINELLKTRKVTHQTGDIVTDPGLLPSYGCVPQTNDPILNQECDTMALTAHDSRLIVNPTPKRKVPQDSKRSGKAKKDGI